MVARSANKAERRNTAVTHLDPRALRGIPAYLYILRNSALKEGLLHIGSSRRGGWAKALELNRDKSNLIPGSYECVFEIRAQDSGAALEALWKILHHTKQGKSSLDFFEIDEQSAQHLMQRCVEEADLQFRQRFEQGLESRRYRDYETERELAKDTEQRDQRIKAAPIDPLTSDQPIREGIFKRALNWLS